LCYSDISDEEPERENNDNERLDYDEEGPIDFRNSYYSNIDID
jgi:hypothetical protein